jgi:predicted amidohydrolase YtcJ
VTTVPPTTSDLAIVNAAVITVDDRLRHASAIAVDGDRISWVGDDAEVAERIGPRTDVIDARGASVVPGFVDSHNHVRLGSNPLEVDLAGAATLEELRARVRAHADAHPEHAWIEGGGWNYAALPGGRLPTWEDLEGLTGGRPAFLFSYDVHNVWMNREAMAAFGIDRGVDTVPFGRIGKDPATGDPTGFVTGFAVMGISRRGQAALEGVVPGYARELQYERTVESLDLAIAYGITTIVEPQNSPDDLWIFERARDEGRLRSRLVAAMFHPVDAGEAERTGFDAARERHDDDRLRVGAIKLYSDDVIEPWTAAMLEPYANRPGGSGEPFWDPKDLAELVVDLDRRGWPCHVHATGDRGIRIALDAFEAARAANGDTGPRHLIVHVECLHPDDIGRFAPLRVAACMQPRHCAPSIVADWRENVGPARWRYAWAFRSLRDAGATLAFSSDWNVAEMDPMIGVYTAITRADLDGTGAWVPEETVELPTAIRAYTMGSAWAIGEDHDRGSVTRGKLADLAILSADLLELDDPRAIQDVHVRRTIVGGATAFSRD